MRVELEFGHLGGVEAHRHTGSSGGVTHLSDETRPLFLILLVPAGRERAAMGPAG